MRRVVLLLLLFSLHSEAAATIQKVTSGVSEGMTYRVDEVATGLDVVWGFVFLSNDMLLVTERDGSLKRVNIHTGRIDEVENVPDVWSKGQGGFLDIALSGDFSPEDWIYFTYVKNTGDMGVTVLARAKMRRLQLQEWQDLFVTTSASLSSRHFGSRIAFDGQGHIFFSVGDRGVRSHAQDLTNHAGTILRLNVDGSIPEDNPKLGEEALPGIWSFGHRNPQGLFWEQETAILWSNEHGPRGGDEINMIQPGANYGWPVVSHGREYWGPQRVGESTSRVGMVDPVKVFTPSIAPGSLMVYSGKAFPGWRRNIFSGALAMTHLNRLKRDTKGEVTGEERLLEDLDERIRAVKEDSRGFIYLSTDSGSILCVRPIEPGGK